MKNRFPRVKEILIEYDRAGIKAVLSYLNQSDMIIDPSTWAGRLMNDIESDHIYTAISKIETVHYKFKREDDNGEPRE